MIEKTIDCMIQSFVWIEHALVHILMTMFSFIIPIHSCALDSSKIKP